MLREIILRELLDHLRSLRFSLTLLLVTTLMLTGSALYVHNYRQLTADHNANVTQNLRLLEDKAERGLVDVVSRPPSQLIFRAPNPLGFIAEGHEKDLPNAFQVSAFELIGPKMKLRGNYTLWQFDQLDWVFVVGFVLSFGALVLTYDGISGERERGTLRLCLSNPISRATLLLGKCIGATLSLAIPLIIGLCISLLIISIFGVVPFSSAHWLRIGVIVLFSMLYVSALVMLGLFISSLTKSSAVSLVLLLLVWVCLVVIIPRTGGLLASGLTEIPDENAVVRKAIAVTWDTLKQHRGGSYNWSLGEPLTGPTKAADAGLAVYDEYRNQQLHQVNLAQNLTRTSPMVIYQAACESLIGTGIGHYERFLKQARQYRRDLLEFTYSKYPLNPDLYASAHQDRGQAWRKLEELKISFDEIPKFEDEYFQFSTSIADAGWDILILFLFNVVFFMGAFMAFMRYSV
jgi:ABC-type transport system involved in multi-copper enzyme maturation permease subunit